MGADDCRRVRRAHRIVYVNFLFCLTTDETPMYIDGGTESYLEMGVITGIVSIMSPMLDFFEAADSGTLMT